MFSDKIAYLTDINRHKSIINLSLFGCRVLFLFDLCGFLSLKHTARRVMNAKTPISSKYKAKKGLRFQTDTKPPGHQWMSRRRFEFMGGLGLLGCQLCQEFIGCHQWQVAELCEVAFVASDDGIASGNLRALVLQHVLKILRTLAQGCLQLVAVHVNHGI